MISSRMLVAAVAVAVLGFAASVRAADECDKMAETLKGMIDKIDDKAAKSDAGKCATFAQVLGLMRIVRIVREECLSDGDKRTNELADLDTGIRGLATATDIGCR